MRNNKPPIPNANFILLYRILGQVKSGEYDYIHNKSMKRQRDAEIIN